MPTQRKKNQAQVAAGGAAGAAAGAAHKKDVLSPYKLYKHDMKKQRTRVTWGPKGKPEPYSAEEVEARKGKIRNRHPSNVCKGPPCYAHKNVDWTLHRLGPAAIKRDSSGRRAKVAGKVLATKHPLLNGGYYAKQHPAAHMESMSPRWGPGIAPGRHARKQIPLPKKGTVEIAKSTKVAAGLAVGTAAVAGAHAVRDRGKRRH